MRPFSTIETESFKNLVLVGRPKHLHVMTRKSLVTMLLKEYEMYKNSQVQEYSKIQYFCMTTDVWSSYRRSFLGVTIHWICPATYKRKHNALACRRIKGKLSGQVLACHIADIIKSFKIPIRKVLKIITDGGSNFKKAFTDHQLIESEETYDEDFNEDMSDILNESENRDEQIFLPNHGRCGSHSMCLILTSDTKSKEPRKSKKKENELSEDDKTYNHFLQTILDPVLKKCKDLFKKQQNSSKAADVIQSHLNRYLLTPSPTRWNSLYDSLNLLSTLITEKPKEMLNIFTELCLEKIEPKEQVILREYVKVISHLLCIENCEQLFMSISSRCLQVAISSK
jgi:hypothetical protein